MKTRKQHLFGALLISGTMTLMAATGAFAAMTPPCTQISNEATLAYTVGGVGQTDITSTLGPANQFYVGVKAIVTVAEQNGAANVSVAPSTTTPAVLQFEVKNDSNAVLDYALLAEPVTDGTAAPWGGTDTFDGTTVNVYVENGLAAGYQASGPNQDTATTIDNLASDGGTKIVYVVYTPSDLTAATGAIAGYYLKATTKWADGSAISQADGVLATAAQAGGACNGAKAISIVFGDVDGPSTTETSRDGMHSDKGAYIVANANIGVTKSHIVWSDPINGAFPNAKAIPGAVIRYSIVIANTGGASALLSSITDTLENTLQIVSTLNNATWNVPASTRGVATKSGTLTADNGAGDGLAHSNPAAVAGTLTATMTTILAADAGYAAGELKAGETMTLTFDATIQ